MGEYPNEASDGALVISELNPCEALEWRGLIDVPDLGRYRSYCGSSSRLSSAGTGSEAIEATEDGIRSGFNCLGCETVRSSGPVPFIGNEVERLSRPLNSGVLSGDSGYLILPTACSEYSDSEVFHEFPLPNLDRETSFGELAGLVGNVLDDASMAAMEDIR